MIGINRLPVADWRQSERRATRKARYGEITSHPRAILSQSRLRLAKNFWIQKWLGFGKANLFRFAPRRDAVFYDGAERDHRWSFLGEPRLPKIRFKNWSSGPLIGIIRAAIIEQRRGMAATPPPPPGRGSHRPLAVASRRVLPSADLSSLQQLTWHRG